MATGASFAGVIDEVFWVQTDWQEELRVGVPGAMLASSVGCASSCASSLTSPCSNHLPLRVVSGLEFRVYQAVWGLGFKV